MIYSGRKRHLSRPSHIQHKTRPLAAHRTAPLDLATLFLDNVLKKADETAQYENKGNSGSSSHKKRIITLMRIPGSHLMIAAGLANQHGKISMHMAKTRKVRKRHQPRVSHLINANYCVKVSVSQ